MRESATRHPEEGRLPGPGHGGAASPRPGHTSDPGTGHTVVLGGIGPDGHSVGLAVLRTALTAAGFRTIFLGTQNGLEDFFRVADGADAVLVSSLDGHGRHYLADFPELRQKSGRPGPLWYVGGNLCIGTDDTCSAEVEALGFDRVFVKFVDVTTVLDLLRGDLSGVVPAAVPAAGPAQRPHAVPRPRRRRRPDPLADRERVLDQWPTGARARDLDASAAFLGAQPSFPDAQRAAAAERRQIFQPRCGVPQVDDQLRLMAALRDAGAAVLGYQVDSLTRSNDHPAVEQVIRSGAPLNGFPVVNHGVPALRDIVSAVAVPLQTRHSTRDPRLLAEISFAGGITAYEGGPVCYNVPYHRRLPLAESLNHWSYVDRLTGLYHERYGIRIDREFFGVLTATLVPPSLAIAINVIEMLLAAEQGVVSVTLGYAEQGNRIQDIAAVRAMRRVAERALADRGHGDVEVYSAFHQYMAAFPADPDRSAELIRASAATAALSGATRVLVKTAVESSGIPTVDDNADAMLQVRRGQADAAWMTPDRSRIAAEEDLIIEEANDILDSVLRGGGDLGDAVVRAFTTGWLDIPFAPSVYNQGRVLTGRDLDGAVRYLSVGDLQFGDHVKAFHEGRMGERLRAEGLTHAEAYRLVERDVMRVPRGEYECWPLDGRGHR